MRARHHIELAGVVTLGSAVGRHGGVAALRVAGEHHLARELGAHRIGGIAGGTHRVDDGGGLRIGVQIGVESVSGLGIAQVVGGDHGIALGGVHGSQQEGFGVLRVGQGAGFEHLGAPGVGHQRRGRRAHAAGHQHDARCVAHLAFFGAWRAVVQRHHLHIALGLAAQGLQAAGCGGGVDLRGREGGDHGGRINQLTANGIVRAATGDQQRGRSRHTGKAKQCHENPSWMTRKEGMVRAPAVQHP